MFLENLLVRERGASPLSLTHPRAWSKPLEVPLRLCASIDRKITKLYENPEKPSNPTEIARGSSASRACQIQLQPRLRKLVDRTSRTVELF